MAANLLNEDANSDRQIVERLKRPPAMYKPEASGSNFMVRNSMDAVDPAARDSINRFARASPLLVNFPSGASNTSHPATAALTNNERIPTTATKM